MELLLDRPIMKTVVLYIIMWAFFCTKGYCFTFGEKDVQFEKEEIESIDLLSDPLHNFHAENLKLVPESVKAEILRIKATDLFDMTEKSMEWAEKYLVCERDVALTKAFQSVTKWSKISGDDVSAIVRVTFWEYVHQKEFQLPVKITHYMLNCRETNLPSVKFSPNGHGEIGWYWRLFSKRRDSGILHVGIDLKKRTFICYESDIGLFFPEGDTMERIYTEIVQEPEMAGIHLGKGLKEK